VSGGVDTVTAGPDDGGSAPRHGGRWIDSHCHLQDAYRPQGVDVVATVTEAIAAGVTGVVCVGTDVATSRQAVDLGAELRAQGLGAAGAERGTFDAWATMGVHPHEASAGVEELGGALDDVLGSRPGLVVAVGECGFDYHYEHSPRQAQRHAFAAQVDLARRHRLTLVVHSREAWDDTLDVLTADGAPERTVLHCFTGGPAEARRCLDAGAYLSFSGIVTFKAADEVRAAAALCPLDRLLVETDAPFLAPAPHRGRENRPAWVAVVGAAVAAVKGVTPEALARSSAAATRAAFALP